MNLFEQLRSPQHLRDADISAASTPPYFVIIPSKQGAHLRVLDRKGNPWIHGYQHFHGPVREALKAIDSIQSREASGFVWDGDGGDISLADNEHLMKLFEQSGRLFNAEMQPISTEDKSGKVVITIDHDKDCLRYNAQVLISESGELHKNFTVLTDETRFLIGKTQIITVPPMGSGFVHLPLFETTVEESELDALPYASLLDSRRSITRFRRILGYTGRNTNSGKLRSF